MQLPCTPWTGPSWLMRLAKAMADEQDAGPGGRHWTASSRSVSKTTPERTAAARCPADVPALADRIAAAGGLAPGRRHGGGAAGCRTRSRPSKNSRRVSALLVAAAPGGHRHFGRHEPGPRSGDPIRGDTPADRLRYSRIASCRGVASGLLEVMGGGLQCCQVIGRPAYGTRLGVDHGRRSAQDNDLSWARRRR